MPGRATCFSLVFRAPRAGALFQLSFQHCHGPTTLKQIKSFLRTTARPASISDTPAGLVAVRLEEGRRPGRAFDGRSVLPGGVRDMHICTARAAYAHMACVMYETSAQSNFPVVAAVASRKDQSLAWPPLEHSTEP